MESPSSLFDGDGCVISETEDDVGDLRVTVRIGVASPDPERLLERVFLPEDDAMVMNFAADFVEYQLVPTERAAKNLKK